MATLEELYNYSFKLGDAKDKIAEHSSDFEAVVGAFAGSSKERRLASQISATHLHHFPQLTEKVLDCLFDLCEDADDLMVRKQAIKDLAVVCKHDVTHIGKVADILVQLLQASDSLEHSLVHISLTLILRLDPKATLSSVFARIITGSDLLREHALSWVQTKVKKMIADEPLAKDGIEEMLIENCKKVLEDVTGSEFKLLMGILTCLPSLQSLQGRQQLIDIVVQQANLVPLADVNETDNMNCLMECLEQASHLFSKNVKSDRFVEHLCLRVLPNLASTPPAATPPTITPPTITPPTTTPSTTPPTTPTPDVQLSIFKILAEISAYAGSLKEAEACLLNIYNKLISYMPATPLDPPTTPSEDFPPLNFSHVECLMTSMHLIGRQCEDFLKDPERLKEFRGRLQYFARGVQVYNKSLRQLQNKSPEDRKMKELALKVTSNIGVLIKDLFHNPPHYHANIHLSFKEKKDVVASPPGSKRPAVVTQRTTSTESAKKARSEQPRYVPPSGKFSSSLNNAPGSKKV